MPPIDAAARCDGRLAGMRVLGAACSTETVNLAVAVNGEVVDGLPERLRPAHGVESVPSLLMVTGDLVTELSTRYDAEPAAVEYCERIDSLARR